MRQIMVIAVAGLSACASAGGAPPPDIPSQTVQVVTGTGNVAHVRAQGADAPRVESVSIARDRAWSALATVYESIGIPVTDRNDGEGMIGTRSFKARGRLGGVPLTRYFNCGSAQGSPNAETYEIHMSVLTYVRPQGAASSTVVSSVVATARPVTFGGEEVRCGSKGALEARIVELLRAAPPQG